LHFGSNCAMSVVVPVIKPAIIKEVISLFMRANEILVASLIFFQ
jgi:hypothetical protein